MGASRRRLMLAALLCGAGGWAPEPTTAVSPGLRWHAPPGCPQRDDVSAQVVRWVGEAALADAAVDGGIELAPTGYVLSLVIDADGRTERREVVSDDCQLLGETAALLVAITLDPVAAAAADVTAGGEGGGVAGLVGSEVSGGRGGAAPADDPAERVSADPTGDAAREAETRRDGAEADRVSSSADARADATDEARRRRGGERRADNPASSTRALPWRHGFDAAISGGLGIALVPAITGGLEAGVGWRFGPIRARALGYHWFGRETIDDDGRGVFAALSGAGLRGCYAVTSGRVDIPVCGGLDLAALWGRGVGSDVDPRSPADLWVAVAAGAGFELGIGRRFALQSRVELVATVRRPALHLELSGVANERFRAPPIGIRIMVGPSIRSVHRQSGRPRARRTP